eukprot:746794-Hanusia_phi.AAC.1
MNNLIKIVDIQDSHIYTEWFNLGNDFFLDKNLYFGSTGPGFNIFDTFSSDLIHEYTNDNVIQIRKLLVGHTEDIVDQPFYLDTSVSTNLLETIADHSVVVAGSLYASRDIQTDSDIRYKTNLTRIPNPIDKIKNINGYTFDRNDTDLKRRFTGLVAQELQQVLPEAVIEKHDGALR